MATRTPPCSEEAEASTLGVILLDNKCLRKCIKKELVPEHFYIPANKLIYAAMLELSQVGRPVDITIISDKLNASGQLDMIGGALYLDKLIDAATTTAHFEHYLDIVLRKSKRREIITAAREAETAAYESNEDEDDLISKIRFSFGKIGFSTGETKNIVDAVNRSIINFQTARKTGISVGVPSRFFDLQQLTSGYYPRSKTIIAGSASAGKTTLALNEALNSAILGYPALIVSIEMTFDEIIERLIADLMSIDLTKYNNGDVELSDIEKFREGGKFIDNLPLYIEDGNFTIERYDAVVREYVEEYGVVLAVLDYIQLVEPTFGSKFKTRNLELSYMSGATVKLGNDTKVAQLILSQLSRGWAGFGKNKATEPELHHLRDCGSLEQDADRVFMIFPDPKNDGDIWYDHEPSICKIAKQRKGAKGRIALKFNKPHNRFLGEGERSETNNLLKAILGAGQQQEEESEDVPF